MYTMDSYNVFSSYQELYRTEAIKNKDLLIRIDCMLPYFLTIDGDNPTLDHLSFDEKIIDFFEEQKALLCPLCGYALNQDDFSKDSFNCKHCNTLFNPIDEYSNSTITSYLYNTMKLSTCQEKNQIFQENISKKDMVANKELQSEDLEKEKFSLPKYLQKNKRTNKESHYLYDSSFTEHLTKAPKGAYICPICNSGLGDNQSGALSYDSKAGYFHCFACGCNLSPIDNATRETVALQLKGIESNSQAKKDAFQDNIEEFNKQLQLQDLGLTDNEKLDVIKKVFSNRGFSDETINYVSKQHDIFIVADDEITHKKVLYVAMFDTNLQDVIGYEKLYYSEREERLAKYHQKGSMLGFTLFSNTNYPNCCFIVESITNALAIYESGFNALCCYTSKEQPYKAYQFALQNGMQPILFLDRDVFSIDSKYISINWLVNIECFIEQITKLKRNADACDLFQSDKQFLCDLLRNAYNTYYKKQCYSQETLEEAFQSDAKFTVIQAQVGNGKTTLAITKYKDALNPLYSVFTKDATEEVADKLQEELKIEANIVNSDSHIITEDKHGIITTHERLSKTTQLEDYAIYGETPIDVAFIDEMHKFLQEHNDTIAQPYYTTNAKEDVKDYIIINNNETMSKYVKDGLSVEVIAYKQNDDKQAVNPIEMPKKVSTTDAHKLQTVYLDKAYSVRELEDPENYDMLIEGTTNIFAKKIDEKLAFWIADYAINANLKEMLSYDYDKIKEELKAKYPKLFNSIRNISLPLSLAFFRNCYLVCAFPIRKHDKKPLSFEEWKQDIQRNIEMETNNNHSIYYKIELRYVNLQPLVNILKKAKRVFLFGASDFAYKDSFIEEFKECFGNDFRYYNLSPLGKKELETSLLKVKKIEDKDIYQVLKGVSSLDCNAVLVTPKLERAKEIYKLLKRHKLNNFTFFTKDCFTSFFSDSVDFETVDNKAKTKPYKNIVVYANAPILESSNKLEDYTLMLIDCNIFKPKIEYANPYLQELGVTITEQLKTKLIQTIGRLYRQKGHKIVIVLLNHTSVEFDIVSFLKEKSEVVNVYEDSNNFTYYSNPKDFLANIARALQGQQMEKYKVARKHKELTEEEKEQRKQERQAKQQAKVLEMVAKGATERDIQHATHDYKERSAQDKLQAYKEIIRSCKPKSASPFDDEIQNSKLVSYDTEVFPNKFVVSYCSDKGSKYVVTNPSNDWLGHFMQQPLIGFNNANYDNPILYYAYIRTLPQCQYRFKETVDFNSDLKAFSDRIINNKSNDKELKKIRSIARAIGIGDSQEMIVKNLQGHSFDSIKCFMLDFGLSLIETPYAFDTVLTDEQLEDVKKYCINDSYTVFLLVKKYYTQFQASLKLADEAGLNGNYSKSKLIEEVIYGKQLTYKERLQYNRMTIDCLLKEFPNFKVLPGIKAPDCYVLEFDDMLYKLGDGGFNLLPKNAFYKDEQGNTKPIKNNHGLHYNVICLDVSSMHPHSLVALNYFGIYTQNYKIYQEMKDICSLLKEKGFDYVKQELAKYGRIVNTQEEVKTLRNCLKLVLNSTYGLTHMKSTSDVRESPLKKCEHNLIALRGALFIASLHHMLIKKYKGIQIIQIKTDSIKIAEYTEEIKRDCENFAKQYGYTFEIEDFFSSICCNGNDYVAVNFKGELIQSSSDEEDQEYTTATKGSSFQLIYDENGILRAKDNLRSLLFTLKGKSIHKLGIKKTIGKKEVIEYAQDVKSTKVKYYLAVKKEYGYYPYYETCKGVKSSVKDLKNQTVIPIYDLKELEKIDKSIIDYSFYQTIFNKFFDSVLSLLIEKKVDGATMNSIDKQTYEKRLKMKYNLLDEKEKKFFDVVKTQLAFV